jgi:hypothetical protein
MIEYLITIKEVYQEDQRSIGVDLLYSFLSPYVCFILIIRDLFNECKIISLRNKLNSLLKK